MDTASNVTLTSYLYHDFNMVFTLYLITD